MMNLLWLILFTVMALIFFGPLGTLVCIVGNLLICYALTQGVPWWIGLIMSIWLYIILPVRQPRVE